MQCANILEKSACTLWLSGVGTNLAYKKMKLIAAKVQCLAVSSGSLSVSWEQKVQDALDFHGNCSESLRNFTEIGGNCKH